MLVRDYSALAHADTCVPDVTCYGAARKAWVRAEDGTPRLIKSSPRGKGTLFGEALASRMLASILPSDEFVPYELVRIGGETYTACPVMVTRDEDLLTALPFKEDLNPANYGVVRDAVGHVRLAPLFDLTGAFGTFNKVIYTAGSKGSLVAALYVSTRFRELDPAWDYSWLDLSALDGFGEELETTLLSCDALPTDYPALARELFEMQRAHVASVIG